MNTPTYRLQLKDFNPDSGISLIAIVDKPAMEVAALKLSQQDIPQPDFVALKATDTHRQILTAPVIIPDKMIPRYSPDRGKFSVYFSREDVDTILEHFMTFGNLSVSNYNHDSRQTVDAHLMEVWVITDAHLDKAVAMGFQDLPVGTLMASYKVRDAEFWNTTVMQGETLGFSLEGLFDHIPVNFEAQPAPAAAEERDEWQQIEDEINALYNQLYADGKLE